MLAFTTAPAVGWIVRPVLVLPSSVVLTITSLALALGPKKTPNGAPRIDEL